MRRLQVYHRVHSHAPQEDGGTGVKTKPLGRFDADKILPKPLLDKLDLTMTSIVPHNPHPVYAVRRIRLEPESRSFACLIVVHRTEDAKGRNGSLGHARVVQTGEAALLDVPPLIEFAYDRSSSPTLADFDFIPEQEQVVEADEWSVASIQSIPPDALAEIIATLLARIGRPDRKVIGLSPEFSDTKHLHTITAAWSLLPLGIQGRCAFAVNAPAGSQVDAAFCVPRDGYTYESVEASDSVREWAQTYVSWVLEHPDAARQFIARDDLRDLSDLRMGLEEIRKDAAMAKKKDNDQKRAAPPPSNEPVQPVVHLNAQVQAIEESLRDAIQVRLTAMENLIDTKIAARLAPPPAGTAPAGTSMPDGTTLRPQSRIQRPDAKTVARATLAIVAVFLIFVFVTLINLKEREQAADIRYLRESLEHLHKKLGIKPPVRPPESQPGDGGEAEPATALPLDLSKIPEPANAKGFVTVVNDHKDAAIAAIDSFTAHSLYSQCPSTAKNDLATIRQNLKDKQKLSDANRQLLRKMLFKYVAARLVTGNGGELRFVIDGDPSNVPDQVVNDLKTAMGATSAASKESADYQAEVVMRWMAKK